MFDDKLRKSRRRRGSNGQAQLLTGKICVEEGEVSPLSHSHPYRLLHTPSSTDQIFIGTIFFKIQS